MLLKSKVRQNPPKYFTIPVLTTNKQKKNRV